ncbi:hypothetical protein NC652_017340 [Populus alba x Populus x berolinensis]|nr:hypothetical protein NC652_017340 [Populus alba x Populus x berolinensis]
MQLIISERIGISPHQFSIFLVNREKRGSRIPVAARTNFSKIYREKDWLFLVVLKRSRRERRIKGHEMMTGNTVRDDNRVAVNGNGLPGLDLGRVDYERRTGMDPGSRWCVYKTVTFGFRSSAGLIARPIKRLAREEIQVHVRY